MRSNSLFVVASDELREPETRDRIEDWSDTCHEQHNTVSITRQLNCYYFTLK